MQTPGLKPQIPDGWSGTAGAVPPDRKTDAGFSL